MFTVADRAGEIRCVVPGRSADEATFRPLFDDHEQESPIVYADGLWAYDPLEDDEALDRGFVVHGEYADGDVHGNTCESHPSLLRR